MTPLHRARDRAAVPWHAAWRAGLALAVTVAMATGTARAQTPDVDGLLRHGVGLRQQGRDEDALGEFQRAWALSQEPRVGAQIALAEQALGRWVSAAEHLEAALQAVRDPWIVRNRGALTESLTDIQRHLGRVRVMGGVPGAEVSINGTRVGVLPMDDAARVVAGTAVLEVRATGYYTVSRRVEIPAGGETRETVDQVTAPVEVPHVLPLFPPPVAPAPAYTHGGSLARSLAWVSLAGAGVGLGMGVTGILVRESVVGQYNTDPACPGARAVTQGSTCQSRLNTGAAMRGMELGGLVGAGVLGAASVVLFLVSPTPRARPSGTLGLTGCGPDPSATGVTCTGRF